MAPTDRVIGRIDHEGNVFGWSPGRSGSFNGFGAVGDEAFDFSGTTAPIEYGGQPSSDDTYNAQRHAGERPG